MTPVLTHATAVVVGTTGILLTGPSGAGKTATAFALVAEARRSGHFAAFVSDDQVWLEVGHGRLIATAPSTIRGKVELRGSGIGSVRAIEAAVLDFALAPVAVGAANRIPEENQRWQGPAGLSLPLYFIDRNASDPFSRLAALLPGFPAAGSFPA